jgi:hypothetical protein
MEFYKGGADFVHLSASKPLTGGEFCLLMGGLRAVESEGGTTV